MTSLFFILRRSLKNSFLELRHKPGKLGLYLFVLVSFVGLFILTLQGNSRGESFSDLIWLEGILFLFILLFCGISLQKGLSDGDAIFDMNDVNLLFVSPVSSKKILLYGLTRMAKNSFLAGFFIFFQGATLKQTFGVGLSGIFIIFALYMLAVMLLSILSLVIYSLTNGNPGRKRLVRIVAVLLLLPPAVLLAITYVSSGSVFVAMETVLRSPLLTFFPVAGWAAAACFLFIGGNLVGGFGYVGLFLLSSLLLLLYIALGRADYYEDVLVATETGFEKKRAMAEGQMSAANASNRKIKVTNTGIGGKGPSALFSLHLRQSLRGNALGLFTWTEALTILAAWGVAFLMGQDDSILIILQILMWMQIFLIAMGQGLRELYLHYIYLIPTSSFSKILWSNGEPVAKVLVQSLLLFGGAGLIMGKPILVILGAIAVYTLFSLLLIGINYLSMRWTGTEINAGLLMVLYSLAVLVIMAPGLIAALMVGFSMGGDQGTLVGMGILSAWELLTALGCFFLSRGVLHRCDMPTMPGKKS